MTLGMTWGRPATASKESEPALPSALWPERWPVIALQECVDLVRAAPPEQRAEVKFNLPCQDCPENGACLNAKAKELGPLMYAREILTSPRSSESSLFPLEAFTPMLNRQQACVPYWRKPFSVEHEYAVCQGWDLAWSEKVGGDWLVCYTAYVHRPTGRRHVLDIERWQRKSFDEQCQLIEAKWNAFEVDLVVIESDAAQAIWSKHMVKTTPVPVLPHAAGEGKTNLRYGVPGLLIELENRRWEWPYQQGTYHHEEIQNFLAEAEAFSWVNDKLQGVGEHDDTVMAWWHCQWGLDRLARVSRNEHHVGVNPGVR